MVIFTSTLSPVCPLMPSGTVLLKLLLNVPDQISSNNTWLAWSQLGSKSLTVPFISLTSPQGETFPRRDWEIPSGETQDSTAVLWPQGESEITNKREPPVYQSWYNVCDSGVWSQLIGQICRGPPFSQIPPCCVFVWYCEHGKTWGTRLYPVISCWPLNHLVLSHGFQMYTVYSGIHQK